MTHTRPFIFYLQFRKTASGAVRNLIFNFLFYWLISGNGSQFGHSGSHRPRSVSYIIDFFFPINFPLLQISPQKVLAHCGIPLSSLDKWGQICIIKGRTRFGDQETFLRLSIWHNPNWMCVSSITKQTLCGEPVFSFFLFIFLFFVIWLFWSAVPFLAADSWCSIGSNIVTSCPIAINQHHQSRLSIGPAN